MTLDISDTTAPRSDQQNYDDYLAGPKTVTVAEVRRGNAEQPIDVELVEFPGRPYKPSKSMRRVLVAAWGPDASTYAGRRMTLYGDPSVKFGGQTVGGIKISHLSHLKDGKPLALALTTTRGKRAVHTVDPLPDAPTPAAPTPLQRLGAAFKNAGMDKDAARQFVADILGKQVAATNMTPDECDTVITALETGNLPAEAEQ